MPRSDTKDAVRTKIRALTKEHDRKTTSKGKKASIVREIRGLRKSLKG